MAPDGLPAGQAGNRLVYHRLKNGCGQVFLGSAFVDQGLDIRFRKYPAAGGNGVNCLIVFRIGVKPRGVCLEQGGHLVYEGASPAGADAVHALFHISTLKINDFGVLPAKFNGYVGLGRIILQSRGHRDDFLHKWDFQMLCQSQPAGAGNHRGKPEVPKLILRPCQQIQKCFTDICKMPLVVCKQEGVVGA